MKLQYIFLRHLLLTLSIISHAQASDSGLRASIEIDSSARADNPHLSLQFQLTNTSSQPVCVLKWNTPLEQPFNGDIFDVRRKNQTPAAYIGRIVKRGHPQPSDFIRLDAGQRIASHIDITDGYAAYEPGDYQISYHSTIYATNACETQEKSIDSTTGKFFDLHSKSIIIHKNQAHTAEVFKVAPAFANCNSSEQSTLDAALTEAEILAQESIQILQATPVAQRSTAERYTTWFGQYTASRYNQVSNHFNTISDVMANRQVTFECTCDVENPNSTFAYVFPNQPYHIHLCGSFWRASMTGRDSKAGTISTKPVISP